MDDLYDPYRQRRNPFMPPEEQQGDMSLAPESSPMPSWQSRPAQFGDPGLDASVADSRSAMNQGEQQGLAANAAGMAQDQQQQGQLNAMPGAQKKQQGNNYQWGQTSSDKGFWGSM
jgi:hypothetical protein